MRAVRAVHGVGRSGLLAGRSSPLLLLLLLVLSQSLGPCVVNAGVMTPIKNRNDDQWDPKSAAEELPEDAEKILDSLNSNANKALKEIIKDYSKTKTKGSNIRKVGSWGITLGKLYDLPGVKDDEKMKNSLLAQLTDIADGLKDAWVNEVSHVEGKKVRGWPFILRNEPEYNHEGFNAGHLGMAMSYAAIAQAEYGEHEEASRNVEYVLAWLYDNFFSYDDGKNKLDDQGRLVWIPFRAPEDRRKRYLALSEVKQSGTEKFCEHQPDAYNHSLELARAVIVTLKALKKIDWSKADWTMPEWTLMEAELRLGEMVRQNARWFKNALLTQKTGDNKKFDNYPGPEGTEWYIWKYREFDVFGKNLENCGEELFDHSSKEGKYAVKLRPQDVSHAKHEVDFIVDYLKWIEIDPPGGCGDESMDKSVFTMEDLRKLTVTFLNRIVRDPGAKVLGERYSCDVSGTYDGEPGPDIPELGNVEPTIEKSCRDRGRHVDERPTAAIGWISLATAAARLGDVQKGADQRHLCDILQMLEYAFSVVDPDSPNFDNSKDLGDGFGVNWGAEALFIKYYFYNYDTLRKKVC